MTKVLGLDLGTNSIGWAVVERDDNGKCTLLDRGVHIFQDGVAHDQSGEKPAVQERTSARALRRHYFRRRLRKIELLRILIQNNYCPFLSDEELQIWREQKKYPLNDDFLAWQRTDDCVGKNPYYDRYVCLTQKLDFQKKQDRMILGRALYHLNQRRGFLSNRKDSAKEDEQGVVKQSITSLSDEMSKAGCRYLGEYFYTLYGKGKIRTRHTARNEHYRAEFDAICKKQELPSDLIKQLEKAIFFQRPLKSQKGSIGKCTFEKGKNRCPVSHPRFEEFRMWSFINSIRISMAGESPRPLNQSEIQSIVPLFFRKSKADFGFEDIAKKLAGKDVKGVEFNYSKLTNVPGCPVLTSLFDALGIAPGEDWESALCEAYTKGDGKSTEQIINDIWHALFNFDDENRLKHWLSEALQLGEDATSRLVKAAFPNGYASLSLKAINKILPWLKKGYLYSYAVFLANLDEALPKEVSVNKRVEVEENIKILLDESREKEIPDYLLSVCEGVRADKLYHPSMIDIYSKALPVNGKVRLGSPRTDAFKNPMALRALFRLRALVNQLLDEGAIDSETRINIEFARGLNDTNKRKAIEDYQRELEKQRKEDVSKLKEAYRSAFGREIEPSDDDLEKYRLWEEQEHKCLYTGKQIGLTKFLGSASEFDIEHTVPRSRGGDNSLQNKTLCDAHYNRFVKKARLPMELADASEILQRVEPWRVRADEFERQLALQFRKKRMAITKAEKDNAIRRIHYLKMKRDYWRGKYERFTMENVPDGFSNRQGVDIGIIGKYARMYLKTVFSRIYIVKGATTADFRKAWGIQREYVKKERINHSHHCIDAVTIACIGKREYDEWKDYMLREERYMWENGERPAFPKPWPSFTEDVLRIPDSLIVSHYTPDNMRKKSRKKLRVRGVIQKNADGIPLYCQGDAARASLHKETFYGAIRVGEEVKYVVRKSLDSLADKDIKNIVDDTVRRKVEDACNVYGGLKNAVEKGIWMNEEKGVPIHKVRVFTPMVTDPVHLKKQRDESVHPHKRDYHVANDGNYCMAVYGDKKPSFILFSALDAARNFQHFGCLEKWMPKTDNDGRSLKCVLKVGTMVLFYEKSPEELLECSQEELSRRLYKVTGLSSMTINKKYSYGTVSLKHHQEGRSSSEIKGSSGLWENQASYRPIINLLHSQMKMLVEGKDFTLSISGKIMLKSVK